MKKTILIAEDVPMLREMMALDLIETIVVPPVGIEPTANGLETRCSIR